MLAALGKKLFTRTGNPREDQACDGDSNHTTYTSQYVQAFADISSFYKLCDLFPYDAYDPKTKLFYNQGSIGFVIETAPLVGASAEMQKEVSNLFALALPEESSLQVLLWADPHLGDL